MSRRSCHVTRGENGLSDLRWGLAILDKKVIKADAWLHYHPCGLKAIQNMVGRDAGLITSFSSETSSTVPDDLTFFDSQTRQEIELDLTNILLLN